MTEIRLPSSGELPYSGEIARKGLHVVAMLMPAGMLLLDRWIGVGILGVIATLAVSADLMRGRNGRFGDFIDHAFGFMMRPTERGADRERTFNGATWVFVSAALLFLVFPPELAAPGMVIAMIADAGAALIGRKYGRHPWPRSRRTVEGSLSFVVTGLVVAAVFPMIPWSHRLAAVIVAAVVEILPLRINDNLLLPFAATAVLWVLAGSPALW